MIEFEKWDNNDNCDIPIEVCELIRDCSACTRLRREGWEAALKWIYYEGVLDHSLAGDLIKKELPDGSI